MKKVISQEKIGVIYAFLSISTFGKMSPSDRLVVVQNVNVLRKKDEAFKQCMTEYGKKVRPDGYNEKKKVATELEREFLKTFGKITNEEQAKQFSKELCIQHPEYDAFLKMNNEYLEECNRILNAHAKQEVELDIVPLSMDGYDDLLSSNNWNFVQAGLIYDLFVKMEE